MSVDYLPFEGDGVQERTKNNSKVNARRWGTMKSKRIQVVLYDKQKEINQHSHKDFFSVWGENGYKEGDMVSRLEFLFLSGALKDYFQGKGRSIETVIVTKCDYFINTLECRKKWLPGKIKTGYWYLNEKIKTLTSQTPDD